MVLCREYYCYKLQIRSHEESILLHSSRLLQQYVVDMYVKIETARLDFFFWNRQNEIRVEVYQSIAMGETHGSRVGRRIILPTSFIGGPRDMQHWYLDAMALEQRFRKPDIFLTVTCNPRWPEILQELNPSKKAHNIPDLVVKSVQSQTRRT